MARSIRDQEADGIRQDNGINPSLASQLATFAPIVLRASDDDDGRDNINKSLGLVPHTQRPAPR